MTETQDDDGRTAVANDPDVRHILDLLRLLPGPTENQSFWASIGTRGESAEPTQSNLKYVYEKMSLLSDFLANPVPERLPRLCLYLLLFFAGERPAIWDALKELDHGYAFVDVPGVPGRLWAEDLTRTAWALYVRYNDYGDDTWKTQWADKNWVRWLSDLDR